MLFWQFCCSKWYTPDEYEAKQTASLDRKRKIMKHKVEFYLQNESLRNSYDSYKMLLTAKSKEYREDGFNYEKINR